MKLSITQVRDCPECKKYLTSHPSLEIKGVTDQYLGKRGWHHKTWQGRTLHMKVRNENMTTHKVIKD